MQKKKEKTPTRMDKMQRMLQLESGASLAKSAVEPRTTADASQMKH